MAGTRPRIKSKAHAQTDKLKDPTAQEVQQSARLLTPAKGDEHAQTPARRNELRRGSQEKLLTNDLLRLRHNTRTTTE